MIKKGLFGTLNSMFIKKKKKKQALAEHIKGTIVMQKGSSMYRNRISANSFRVLHLQRVFIKSWFLGCILCFFF